jgi:predicted permease
LSGLGRDLRHAFRQLRRSPGFTVVAVLTLSLGIGAATVVFSVLHSVLWRSLPYPDANRLVVLRADARGVSNTGVAPGEVLDLRAQSRLLASLEMIHGVDAHVQIDGEQEYVAAASATDGLLPLLGATPLALGRSLRAEEDIRPEWVRSVVISHGFWQRRFGGDAGALGREIQVNNLDVRIIGILRPSFRLFLPRETLVAEEIEVWFPGSVDETRTWRGLPVIGQLAPGATLSALQAELDVLAARFVAEHPADYPDGRLRITARPLRDDLTVEARPALFALAVAVGFVLLIACVNVANLLLARGRAREREIAVRRALGASRGQVASQLFAESLLLAAAAGVAGLWLAVLAVDLVEWLQPAHLPRQSQIAVNGTVVLFGIVLSAATTLLFGVLPALRLTSTHGLSSLSAGRADTPARPLRRLQCALVVGEVALSIVPLVGAGLMLRTFHNLLNAPIGFDPSNVLTAQVAMSYSLQPDSVRWSFFHQQVLPQVRELPGVEDVSAAGPLPFASWHVTRRYGRADADPVTPLARATQQSVMPGYLRIMGIRLRAGRDFTGEDLEAERQVAIVDERMARQLWPGGAVGERLVLETGRDRRQELEIVGVTAPVRTTAVRDDELPHFFVPYHLFPVNVVALVIRTEQDPAALGPAIERIVEPQTRRAVFDVRRMSDYVADSMGDTRFAMLVLLSFAAASLLLATVGVHGTLAYLISQRRRELGVRLALGATAPRIATMIVREGAGLVAIGVVIGLVGALATTDVLRGLLYDVTPFDEFTLLSVCGVMAAVALLASWLPARRAARVDPMTALRAE